MARPLVDEYRAAATGQRNAARWSVALALGLRQGEALGLQWDDVDLDASVVHIRQQLQRQRGQGLVLTSLKSTASRRAILLPGPLAAALRLHRTAQLEERLAAGQLWEDHRFLCAQPNGRGIDPSRDHAAWKELLTAAGVRTTRLHDARHTAATLLLTQGVPARVRWGSWGTRRSA